MPVHSVVRKLAAILVADVVGHSRHMGEDEAGTQARLKARRREFIEPKVSGHRGGIVKTTRDGTLIEFPSAVGAAACEVTVQRGMAVQNGATREDQRIVFRVEVNLSHIIGEVHDTYGDGVNVAARLEGVAGPDTVRDHIGDRLDLAFDGLGEQVLRNIARRLQVHGVRPEAVARQGLHAAERRAPDRLHAARWISDEVMRTQAQSW